MELSNKISNFDWVIFTSVNGVERFFSRFYELRDDIRDMAGPRIAAIGPITARAIQERAKSGPLGQRIHSRGVARSFFAGRSIG